MKKKEIIIISVVFIVALIFYVGYQVFNNSTHQEGNQMIAIKYHNETIQTFDPTVDATYTVTGDVGEMVIEVKDGKWHMLEADCPNQICVNTGWVSLDLMDTIANTGIITCIPNDIVVAPE